MAALREVIIGNIRLTITAGSNPSDRQIMMLGEATMYDQNVNPTRTYNGDLSAQMTPADQATCAGLIDRFIQALMVEHEISPANLDEGQAILDGMPQPTVMTREAGPLPPEPIPMAEVPMGVASVSGDGTLVNSSPHPQSENTSTETGEGTLIPPEDV